MLARPRVLSLITTRRCTAACDHCCNGSSPRAQGAIPLARMHALIEEAQQIPSIRRIGFTGGECFLLGSALDALVAHAHRLCFETRVVTNGYWAVNAGAARARVAALRTAGLDEMMLSTGTFHQSFVPVARVVHGARAAAEAGIRCRIAVETCDQQTFDDAVLHEELAAEIAARRIFIGHDPWTPDAGGRGAAALSHDRLHRERRGYTRGSCAQILDTITVTPDQHLQACCGFPTEQLPMLRIGSVANATLPDALRDSPNELLKMWLHVAGPQGVAEFVARYEPGYALPPTASICHACAVLQRDARAMSVVAQHGAAVAQAVEADYI